MTFQSTNNLYGFPQPTTRVFPAPIIAQRAPTTADIAYPIGQQWVDEVGDDAYVLVDVTANTATWNVTATTPGNVDTLSGNTGGAITPSAGNINIVGGPLVTVAGAGNTLTINPKVNGYPITPYVVGPVGMAGYQTIQGAINAANAAGGGMVFVQKGTFTENLTFFDNIQLFGDSESGTFIVGTHIPPTTGILNINRVTFQDTTAIFSSAAAGSAQILVEDTTFTVTNGFSFDLVNWTGQIQLFNIGNFGTNDGGIRNTGGATVYLFNGGLGNGTGQTMVISGVTVLYNAQIGCPLNFVTGANAYIDGGSAFSGTVTFSNNSTGSATNSNFMPGSGAAITMSSSAAWSVVQSTINSSNNPAISGTGAGVLSLGNITFDRNSTIANTLTVNWLTTRTGPGSYPISPFVVGVAGQAGYQTIQSALDAANALAISSGNPQTVYIQPGFYTENLTLYNNVDLCGCVTQVDTAFLTITGTHTPPTTGTLGFYNIWFIDATAIFSSAAAGSTTINMFSCITNVTNGYTFNLVNWTGFINIYDFFGEGANDGFINNTGGASATIITAGVGGGTGNTMNFTGPVYMQSSQIACPMNFETGSTMLFDDCQFSATMTFSNNSTGFFDACRFTPGAVAAMTMSSSAAVSVSNSTINSSNNPAIAGSGAGTLTLTGVDFLSNGNTAGTLTLAYGTTITGGIRAIGTSTLTGTVGINATGSAVTTIGTGGTGAVNIGNATGNTAVTGSLTASTTLTATLGAITATNGNVVLGTAGNKLISSSVASTTTAGANSFGTVTLVNGTATVATTAVTSSSIIVLTRMSPGSTGAAALGILSVGTITNATSFVINALTTANSTTNATTDVSSVGWMIIN